MKTSISSMFETTGDRHDWDGSPFRLFSRSSGDEVGAIPSRFQRKCNNPEGYPSGLFRLVGPTDLSQKLSQPMRSWIVTKETRRNSWLIASLGMGDTGLEPVTPSVSI